MAEVTFTPNHVPPPACYPSDINGLLDSLTTGGGITGTIPDQAGGGVFVGSAPPPSALTNKVWYKIDGAGRPLGVYMFYNGNWRKVYTGVALGEVRMYAGGTVGIFDGTGRGIVGGDLDGWGICNGQNGTISLGKQFIAPGYRFDGVGWVTDVISNTYSGGVQGPWTLTPNLLPQLSVLAWGVPKGSDSGGPWPYLSAPGGNAVAEARWNITETQNNPVNGGTLPFPPYVALGFIEFIGYQ